MTGKTQAARQPSIDDLLASIRQAIHERVPPPSGRSPSTESARLAAVPETGAEAGGTTRTIAARGREGFAGLLGGDVRLEQALARLNQPGWRGGPEAPVATRTAEVAAAAPAGEPRLRPTIRDWGDGLAAPAGGPRQPWEGLASPGAPKRDAAAPRDEPRKEGTMHEHGGGSSRPGERPARPPAVAREDAREKPAGGDLLSRQAASAANSAFSRLNDATAPRATGPERPLDEMTRDCLRPLLKAWLDENLPGMVERLVREEIARVARRGS